MRKWLIIFCVLLSCQKKDTQLPETAYPVRVTKTKTADIPIFIESLGHVESITSIQIKSRIEGELTGVYFTQGQEVKKGDLLFTIDPKPYQADLEQAKAVLKQNEANLALAQEKVKRYRLLAKDEYYSQIDYETLQSNFASTSALVLQNKAQIESALINLDYCWIYAPIDGVTGTLQVDFGNLVANDGTTLTTLNQIDPIYVTFSIPENQFYKVQKLQKQNKLKVQATHENFSENLMEGELFMFDNTVNAKTGMITLKALFSNDQKDLWPGQFVRTRIILYTLDQALLIPYTAVQLTQTGPVVFVVKEDNTVEERKVVLGQRDQDKVVIEKGLLPKESIVLEGQLNLVNGSKVEVQP